jgi:hypothetical protein
MIMMRAVGIRILYFIDLFIFTKYGKGVGGASQPEIPTGAEIAGCNEKYDAVK